MKKEKKSPRYDAAAAVGALRFEEVLALIHEGRFRDECTALMRECVGHVMKKGGKPPLMIKITFGGQDDSGMQMLADVKNSLPAKVRAPQYLYARDDGHVFEYDPDEVELDLEMRAVPGSKNTMGEMEMLPVPGTKNTTGNITEFKRAPGQ